VLTVPALAVFAGIYWCCRKCISVAAPRDTEEHDVGPSYPASQYPFEHVVGPSYPASQYSFEHDVGSSYPVSQYPFEQQPASTASLSALAFQIAPDSSQEDRRAMALYLLETGVSFNSSFSRYIYICVCVYICLSCVCVVVLTHCCLAFHRRDLYTVYAMHTCLPTPCLTFCS
jgi:hypothetical protein